MSKKAVIIAGGVAPHLNEAAAWQTYLLSSKLNARVITCNDIGLLPFKRLRQYLIINTRFFTRKTPILSLLNGIFLYSIIKFYEKKFDVIHIPGGINSIFLDYLDPGKCICWISSLPPVDDQLKARIRRFSPELLAFVAQAKRVESQLIDLGIPPGKICLLYPLIDLDKFKPSAPPPLKQFRILFASSPNMELPGENNFEYKGVPLLLESFREFRDSNDAFLYLLWRGKHNKELYTKIEELGLQQYVQVINETVDTVPWYSKCHITVIPYMNLWRSPEIPLSALESLASGRPVVATDVAELAEMVERYKCGCTCQPTKKALVSALEECQRNYPEYQGNSRNAVQNFLLTDPERLKKAYLELLAN